MKEQIVKVDMESVLDLEKLKRDLVRMGYERMGQVEGPGTVCHSGRNPGYFPSYRGKPCENRAVGR